MDCVLAKLHLRTSEKINLTSFSFSYQEKQWHNAKTTCHGAIHSDPLDSVLGILDCFWMFTLLMDHLLALGPVPLDHIMFISLVLHLLHIYSLMYIVTSPQLED